MIRGLYAAASGLIMNFRQQEVVANNIANLATPGYKAEVTAEGAFTTVLVRSIGNAAVPLPVALERVIGRVGTSAQIAVRTSYLKDGKLRPTDSTLDLALRGEGAFFAVQSPAGTIYTRNGQFARDRQGVLISGGGLPVLGVDGNTIAIRGQGVHIEEIEITGNGEIFGGGRLLGRILVVQIDLKSLERAGADSFVIWDGSQPGPMADGASIVQNSLEESNIDVGRMAAMLFRVSQNFEANQRVFQTIDDNLAQAVREIGRVR
ncbi:MAG: flagellar hook-basal body protein [Dehalococcoidia bacterium]